MSVLIELSLNASVMKPVSPSKTGPTHFATTPKELCTDTHTHTHLQFLCCAVPRRTVAVPLPVPVRLLVQCITVTFRLSVRVSLPVYGGQYVLFEAFEMSTVVSCVVLLVAVSSTISDFKPYLICKRGTA